MITAICAAIVAVAGVVSSALYYRAKHQEEVKVLSEYERIEQEIEELKKHLREHPKPKNALTTAEEFRIRALRREQVFILGGREAPRHELKEIAPGVLAPNKRQLESDKSAAKPPFS